MCVCSLETLFIHPLLLEKIVGKNASNLLLLSQPWAAVLLFVVAHPGIHFGLEISEKGSGWSVQGVTGQQHNMHWVDSWCVLGEKVSETNNQFIFGLLYFWWSQINVLPSSEESQDATYFVILLSYVSFATQSSVTTCHGGGAIGKTHGTTKCINNKYLLMNINLKLYDTVLHFNLLS